MTIVDVTSSGNTKTYTLRRFYAVYGRDGGNALLDGSYAPTLVAVKRIVNQHYMGANVEGWAGLKKSDAQ